MERVSIVENIPVNNLVHKMTLKTKDSYKNAKAGQFVNVYLEKGEMLLPRPISISEIKEDTITLLYQKMGKGTKYLATLSKGDHLRILGPLGNGFTVPKDQGIYAVVGGGIGIACLPELIKSLKGEVHCFLGFRELPFYIKQLESLGCLVSTISEKGEGKTGNVLDLLKESKINFDKVYACGPTPMLKALSDYAKEKTLSLDISMEERMGCGFGACVGCTVKIRVGDEILLKKVCQDGPVFNSREVVWI